MLNTPPVISSKISKAGTLYHNSFNRRASRIFNALPKVIRNMSNDATPDLIKRKLDKFLNTVTDEPRLPGYLPTNCSASNRLEDQIWVMESLSEEHH